MPSTSSSPRLTLIAAVARNGAIGLDNALPWHLPEDLKHFKALTLGHPIIMGRRTWESLGRPLPGRDNLVVSRRAGLQLEGAVVVSDLSQALAWVAERGRHEAFIIGGVELFRLALPQAHCLELTEIDQDFAGDTWFPAWVRQDWREASRTTYRAAAGFDYAFVRYERALGTMGTMGALPTA